MNDLLRAHLWVDYPGKPNAVAGVELSIQPGEIYGLVGRSGSGKSTLGLGIMRLLSSRSATIRGTLMFEGRDLFQCSERQMRSVRGRRIGMIPQNAAAALNPHLRLRTQMKEAWRAHSSQDWKAQECKVLDLLARLDLPVDESFLHRYPREISTGQAQRVLLTMANLHGPSLLIADEPTSALDPIARAELVGLFRKLNGEAGTAFLFISHDMPTVLSLCHRVGILLDGKLVECGDSQEILQTPAHPYTQALVSASRRVDMLKDHALEPVDCRSVFSGAAAGY